VSSVRFHPSQTSREKYVKRILLNRWVIGILAVTGVLLALQYLVPTGEHDEISTSRMIQYIETGEVDKVKFIDGDQIIEATLDGDVERDGGSQVKAYWLSDTQAEI
jgi:cell division protease FtsH